MTILKHQPLSTKILEVGPGRGEFQQQCLAQGMEYVGIDVNLGLLSGLREGTKSLLSRVPPLPLAEGHFDVSFAANLLEHMVDYPQALTLLREMNRVTRSGGLVVQRVPDALAWGMHFWNGDYSHSFVTTKRRMAQIYRDAGLKVVSLQAVSGPWIGTGAGLLSMLGRLIPGWLVDQGADPDSLWSKRIYSAKTTFLKGIIIVGRCP